MFTVLLNLQLQKWHTGETTYFFCIILFSVVTLPADSYMSQVSKQCPVFGYFWIIFTEYPIISGMEIQKFPDKKNEKRWRENISHSFAKGKLRRKMKRSFLINYVCHADFYILRNLQRLLFTSILRSSRSESFGKSLETHPWWRTILEKLLSCPLNRASFGYLY